MKAHRGGESNKSSGVAQFKGNGPIICDTKEGFFFFFGGSRLRVLQLCCDQELARTHVMTGQQATCTSTSDVQSLRQKGSGRRVSIIHFPKTFFVHLIKNKGPSVVLCNQELASCHCWTTSYLYINFRRTIPY
jgi:hypothetical protein